MSLNRCEKCQNQINNSKGFEIDIHEWDTEVYEVTLLCESCYQSFIVYFDNFMEEK